MTTITTSTSKTTMTTPEMIAGTIKKITIRMIAEIIKRMIKKTIVRNTTTTSMMSNTDMNTLMIMANMETNMHHMKKNKY